MALRVADVAADAVTALTVEGDPLAGIVTFRFRDQEPGVRVEIVVEAAATTFLDRVLASAGGALEDFDWPGALERIVELSGRRAPAGIERDVRTLDPDEAETVRRRAERLRVARRRAEAPAVREPAAAREPAAREPAARGAATIPRAKRTRRPRVAARDSG